MSTVLTDNLKGKTAANAITITVGASATQSLKNGIAKSWFRYDQRTDQTLESSLNISSAVDDTTGAYSMNLSNNLSSMNDASLSSAHDYSHDPLQYVGLGDQEFGTQSTSHLEGYTSYNTTLVDATQVFGQQFGDLA